MSLPPETRVEDFPGVDYAERWKAYLDHAYSIFCDEIANAHLRFQGCPVRCRYQVPFDGKHASFWHLMSEGKTEENRVPDLERCARMSWVAWVIKNADDPAHVRWWENERSSPKHGRSIHVPLWLFEHDYAVILQKRTDEQGRTFYLVVTSYCVKSSRKKTFEREWAEWNS